MRRRSGATPVVDALCRSVCSILLAQSALAHIVDHSTRWPCNQLVCTGSPVRVGCFHDSAKARTINSFNFSDAAMSQEKCMQSCSTKGYALAGVEAGDQCFCGNIINENDPKPVPSWCSSPTPGNTTSKCCGKASHIGMCGCPSNITESCGGCGLVEIFNVSAVSCKVSVIKLPYCNSSLPIADRVSDVMGRMTISEKIQCLSSKDCEIDRLSISIQWHEALHGLRYPCIRDISGRSDPLCATSFPHAQLLAASFNRSLWQLIGSAIATEARAFYNIWASGNTSTGWHALSFWAPDINLCRDPRWGRCLEVASECPIVTGEYAMGYVGSLQTRDQSRGYYKALANAKHFSAYDVEKGTDDNGKGTSYNRGDFNAIVPERDLVQTYWHQFRTATQGADLRGTMCSYNAVNGVPSCANSLFNNQVLRRSFGFTGMIVSDCGAVMGIGPDSHNFTHNINDTIRAALKGGTDLNCGTVYVNGAEAALENGSIDETDIDQALSRVLTQVGSVGLLDASPPWSEITMDEIDSESHRNLAQTAAEEGFVLLKNNGKILPLKSKSNGKPINVAVFGPHLNSSTQLLANYYGENLLVETSTPLLGLKRRSELNVVAAIQGCDLFNISVAPDMKAIAAAASSSDVAIVFAGLHSSQGSEVANGPGMEREGFDRTNITLPGFQEPLIKKVVETGVPTVVVFINSGGLAAEWVYGNAGAVLEAYYPGELGGDAIASVLLGDSSPSGRLTNTIYPANFVLQRNITDMALQAHDGIPGITYRFYGDKPLFPFGYGMSYTSWKFEWEKSSTLSTTTPLLKEGISLYLNHSWQPLDLAISIGVTNSGTEYTSDISVLCFASTSLPNYPVKQLVAFDRVSAVAPGEKVTVTMYPIPTALTLVNDQGTETISAATFSISCGGDPDGFVDGVLEITGSEQEIFRMPNT